MTEAELRRQIKDRVDVISEDRLRIADDFLAYLLDRESVEATAELMNIPGMLDRLKEAEQSAKRGELTPAESLRRKRSA